MNIEDALLLFDRHCENDNENQTVEQVNPVIEFPPIYPELTCRMKIILIKRAI